MYWHLVTGEFPPQPGGVSDYTLSVARGLASAGESVHVWCPTIDAPAPEVTGVAIHAVAGQWDRKDLRRVDRELDAQPGPRRLLVQWVPHAYGHRSMNVAFCQWVRSRARKGDIVDVMVHEVFLAFGEGSWKEDVAAIAHRLMLSLLLSVARRVWVSIPAWAGQMRPYAFGRKVEYCWLPVPSNVPVLHDADAVRMARARFETPDGALVGHFSTYGAWFHSDLERIITAVTREAPSTSIVLMGRNGDAFLDGLISRYPKLRGRVHATGGMRPELLSAVLQACDVVVQPYGDGASSRRGTLMAALAHGVPVVTTEGRLSETVWRETNAVCLVAPGDQEVMASAVVALCRDAGARARLASAGRALYAERFDLSHTIHALIGDSCRAA